MEHRSKITLAKKINDFRGSANFRQSKRRFSEISHHDTISLQYHSIDYLEFFYYIQLRQKATALRPLEDLRHIS